MNYNSGCLLRLVCIFIMNLRLFTLSLRYIYNIGKMPDWRKDMSPSKCLIYTNNICMELIGSLTPEHLEITHKASNGLIFLSNFQFTIPRYS